MGHWYRPWHRWRSIPLYVMVAVLGLTALCGILGQGWSSVPFAVIFVPTLVFLWLSARCGVDVGEHGIRAVRLLHTDFVPWEELAAIEVSQGSSPQLLLRRIDGTIVQTRVYRDYPRQRYSVWLRAGAFDRMVTELRSRRP